MARIPMTASSTRRKRERSTNRRRNGWNARWSDQLKIKEGETAWIVLTPGDYPAEGGDRSAWLGLPMYKVQYQNQWGNQSWGYFQGNRGDCTLRARSECGDNRVSAPRYEDEPNRFWMNVIHVDLFKSEDVLDKQGEVMRYSRGKLKGKVVKRWEPVKSIRKRKQIIENGDFEDCVFFRKKFMELPASHFDVLKGIALTARTMCECGGVLEAAAYTCNGCGEVMLDVDNTDLSVSEVAKYGDSKRRCEHCGHNDYPEMHSICGSCDDPSPLSPWAVVAKITKVREGQYPTIRILKVEPLTEHELPDGSFICEEGDEDGMNEEFKKLSEVQFDLEEYTAPKDNSYYSDILELREGDIGFASNSQNYDSFR